MALAFVKATAKIVTDNTAGSSAGSFATLPAVGNLIVVTVAGFNSGSGAYTLSSSDNQTGNTYASRVSQSFAGTLSRAQINDTVVVGSSGTFTISNSMSAGSGKYFSWAAAEFSGQAATPQDRTGATTNSTNGTSASVTTSANLTANDELVVACIGSDSGNNLTSITLSGATGTLFDEPDGTNHQASGGGYKLLSGGAGATQTATFNWTTNALEEAIVIATYAPAAGGSAYTLAATAGSYTISGAADRMLRAYLLPAATGSYAIAGVAARLLRGYKLQATAGSYAVTGAATTPLVARLMGAAPGAYALTGRAAVVARGYLLPATAGTYALTGLADLFKRAYVLGATKGTYNLTAPDANLNYSGQIVAPDYIIRARRLLRK